MAKAPRLPKKPVTEEAKKEEERNKKRAAKKRRDAREKAEKHKMKEPAKKQPTGRGRPKRKPKAVGQTKAHDAVASKAEKERIEKANKANAKLETKKPVVGKNGKVKQGSLRQQNAEMKRVKVDQRILNENMLTPEERRRREKIAEEKRAKEARAAQEKKDFPNKRRAVVKGKLRARAAMRNAGTIQTNDPKSRFKNSKNNKVQTRQVNPPRTNDQTPEGQKASKKAARRSMLKKLGNRIKGLTIKGVAGFTGLPLAFAESTNRDTPDFKGSSRERREAGRRKVLTTPEGLEKYNFKKTKPDPKPKPKPDPKPASKKVSANEIKPKPKPKPKPINPKYKKSKFGVGGSKTVEHKGKKLANVTKEQLNASGLSLRQYMNKWNKTGKRP